MYTTKELKARGWTDKLIKDCLKSPDVVKTIHRANTFSTRYSKKKIPLDLKMYLYNCDRVHSIESTSYFLSRVAKSKKVV